MKLPASEPGLVIRYSYLWCDKYLQSREDGVKDRPCAIIVTTAADDGDTAVFVLPVTHSAPPQPAPALEIPSVTKRRLGLDSERSWIVFSEANRFVWPGPDLRPTSASDASSVAYGMLPPNFFAVLRDRYLAAIRAHRSKIVPRTE